MSPTLSALSLLVKALGITFGTMAVLVIILIVFLDIWAKRTTSNKVFAFFLEERNLFGKLLPIKQGRLTLGRGEHKEEYFLDVNKQFWAWWPPGIPKVLQVPVRAHLYVRNVPEPFDPENLVEPSITSRSLKLLTDEAMLRSSWRDVRESTGVAGKAKAAPNAWILILVFVAVLLGAFNLYMTMNLQTTVGEMAKVFGVGG